MGLSQTHRMGLRGLGPHRPAEPEGKGMALAGKERKE